MLRSVFAVLAGYATMVVMVSSFIALVAYLVLGGMPEGPVPYDGPAYVLWLELGWSLVAALAGGYVCGWVARRGELKHTTVLGAVVVVLGAVSVVADAGMKPLWSSIGLVVIAAAGTVTGGYLRQRHVQAT